MRPLAPLVLFVGLLAHPFAAEAATALDELADPRLTKVVSVTAHHTTVGAVLTALARETGVKLTSATETVREEPVLVFLRHRSLHSVLELLAEQFRADPDPQSGWTWRRRGAGEQARYELADNWQTRRAVADLRIRDRQWLAQELAALRTPDDPLPAAPASASTEQVLAVLPSSLVQAALAGKPAALRWREFPARLQDIARSELGPADGGVGTDTWVELRTQGAGSSLGLFVSLSNGVVGSTFLIRPPKYQQRFTQAALASGSPEGRNRERIPYSGLAERPVRLSGEERQRWHSLRTLPELLELLAGSTGAEFIADDFDYRVHWQGVGVPRGEALGVWLDLLPQGVSLAGGSDGSLLRWQEKEKCLLLRSQDWYAQEAERPPAALRARLRARRRQGDPGVLSLDEAATLLGSLDEQALARLEWRGSLRPLQFSGQQALLQFWNVLPAAQRRELFSEEGLRISALPPEVRRTATATGPGLQPFLSEAVLTHRMGGDATFWFRLDRGKLECRRRPAVGREVLYRMDLRLPEQDPEVLEVTLETIKDPAPA